MQIDISFGNWKRLTALLENEEDSYDRLIARLMAREIPAVRIIETMEAGDGAVFKGVSLPNGTRLRGSYRGKTYFGEIRGSSWIDVQTGEPRRSPSEAAHAVTNTTINGWLFWSAKRPTDSDWQSLAALRSENVR